MIDYHSHILPSIDDGSKDIEMSVQMINLLNKQGIDRIIATPHFYAHREKSVDDFLDKRSKAYEKLSDKNIVPEIFLGAEVSLERDVSSLHNIEKLAIEGTNLILIELPYSGFGRWIPDEIYNLTCEYNLVPIIAHIHRYTELYSKDEINTILSMDAVFQINNEAFSMISGRRFVKSLLKDGRLVVFGSDCHNLGERKPNFDLLKRKCSEDAILNSDEVFDEYRI
jgi:protein-tyrosine phosphatase